MTRARDTFKSFHKRDAGTPVYPFDGGDIGEFHIPAGMPQMVHLGRAIRTCYTSDKWHEPGKVVSYYHDHGPEDGKGVLTGANKVAFYAPQDFFPEEKAKNPPVKWPDELVLLGSCDEWFVQPDTGDEKLVHGSCENSILLCSPYGWVSKKHPERVFLVIVEVPSGHVEGIIDGPGLIVTPAGIEG